MPFCKNDPKKTYKGNEPSPKGFGYCAHSEKIGTMKRGKDGKVWIVKKFKNIKKWVFSDFYTNFKKSENQLKLLLKKSIVSFNYKSFEDKLKKNKKWFDKQENNKYYFPEIEIDYNLDNLGEIEFKRCACESEFYKYVINTGSDFKLSNKKIKKRSYFFDIDPAFKIWKDFNKECIKYHKENTEYITNLIKNNKLSKKELDYVSKIYKISIK